MKKLQKYMIAGSLALVGLASGCSNVLDTRRILKDAEGTNGAYDLQVFGEKGKRTKLLVGEYDSNVGSFIGPTIDCQDSNGDGWIDSIDHRIPKGDALAEFVSLPKLNGLLEEALQDGVE